jgi:hypothetical protein
LSDPAWKDIPDAAFQQSSGEGEPMSDKGYTIDDHLRHKDGHVVDLYRRLVSIVEARGPFEYAVAKTGITFKGSRRGFAGAKPKADRLDGYFDLTRRIEDPRILNSSPYTKRLFVHQFRVTELDQLDETFAGWIREAYGVGQGKHLQEDIAKQVSKKS